MAVRLFNSIDYLFGCRIVLTMYTKVLF
jgi:hypothetical protein